MRIILVDDHFMAVEFYFSFLTDYFSSDADLAFHKVYNCEQAYCLLANSTTAQSFDWAFVDYRLPPFKDQNLLNGADIVTLIREKSPGCKIIMITGHTEPLAVYDLIWSAHPEGIAAKCDINFENLQILIETVYRGSYYKSATIQTSALKVLEEKVLTDSNNRKIISLILQGYRIKDLPSLIMLKPSTIHRRILNIKKALLIPDDTNMVRELIDRGYVNSIYSG